MTTMTVHHRQPVATRRLGYVIAIGINLLLLYLINGSPGWQAVPFLTDATVLLLGLVNASLILAVAANLVYVLWDPRWLRALGDVATTSIGLAVMVRTWQVFPFDFGTPSVDWDLVARVALGIAIGGTSIAIIVAVVAFFRSVAAGSDHIEGSRPLVK